MHCLHCKQPLGTEASDFSLKLMLCSSCSCNIKQFRDRIRSELQGLLARVDDVVRYSVTHDLVVDTQIVGLLHYVIHLDERCHQAIQSSRTSKLSAITADGSESSPKP